jgi:hypothetical protein
MAAEISLKIHFGPIKQILNFVFLIAACRAACRATCRAAFRAARMAAEISFENPLWTNKADFKLGILDCFLNPI